MRIKVNLSNILEYGLDTLTGNSRADLLARAEELHNNGLEMYVTIPDAEGGDNDAPTERNAFEHYATDLPEPEGPAHKQEALNLAQQAYVNDPCSYKPIPQIDGSEVWICAKHNMISKHSVDAESHAPCEFVDPFETDV